MFLEAVIFSLRSLSRLVRHPRDEMEWPYSTLPRHTRLTIILHGFLYYLEYQERKKVRKKWKNHLFGTKERSNARSSIIIIRAIPRFRSRGPLPILGDLTLYLVFTQSDCRLTSATQRVDQKQS